MQQQCQHTRPHRAPAESGRGKSCPCLECRLCPLKQPPHAMTIIARGTGAPTCTIIHVAGLPMHQTLVSPGRRLHDCLGTTESNRLCNSKIKAEALTAGQRLPTCTHVSQYRLGDAETRQRTERASGKRTVCNKEDCCAQSIPRPGNTT